MYFHIGNCVVVFVYLFYVYFSVAVVVLFFRVNRAVAKPRHLPQSCFLFRFCCFILKEESKILLNTKKGAVGDIYL